MNLNPRNWPNAPAGRLIFGAACFALLVVPQALWWRSSGGSRRRESRIERDCLEIQGLPPARGDGAFTDITRELRLDFEHVVGPPGTFFFPEINGAGCCFFDYDDDGDLDIFFPNSGRSPHAVGKFPLDLRQGNGLYRQESDGSFTDVTEAAGVAETGYSVGCAAGDIDNDGDVDLYVTCHGPDRLLENRGDGTFRDISERAGIVEKGYSTGAAFFDYDRDGWLDIYVAHYASDPIHDHSVACDFGGGRFSYCGPLRFTPDSDHLFHNDGAGEIGAGETGANGASANGVRFSDATASAGIDAVAGTGFTPVVADFNRDGWPDVYVSNDMHPNRMWINRQGGSFADEAAIRGAAVDGAGAVGGSMGVALGDVDGNSFFDLVVTKFNNEGCTLYTAVDGEVFIDATAPAQLLAPTKPHIGWGVALIDIDHDGDLDMPLVNGLVTPCDLLRPTDRMEPMVSRREEVSDAAAFWSEFADRNLLFQNVGQTFDEVSAVGGDLTTRAGSARSLAYGDVDNDGDLDLLVTYLGEGARLYRNDAAKSGRWLQVRAIDGRLKRDAYGAEIVVSAGGKSFLRTISPATGYLSSNDVRAHFGLGKVDRYDAIEIRWPDGLVEKFPGGDVDRSIVLRRGEAP